MQLLSFSITGRNQATGRRKTIKTKAISIEDAKEFAISQGLCEPFECIEHPVELPTESQINYATDLEIIIPHDATKEDLRQLIENKLIGDSYIANSDLIDFANHHRMIFSKYIGKKALYDLVFESLKDTDKIAFFIFCVYRDWSNDRRGNLEIHPSRQKFYDFAFQVCDNEKIVKSINRYTGKQIRYFKFTNEKGDTYYGGSMSTVAYKAAIEYLEATFSITDSKDFQTANKNTTSYYKTSSGYKGIMLNTKRNEQLQYNNTANKSYSFENKKAKSNYGCLILFIVSIILILIFTFL